MFEDLKIDEEISYKYKIKNTLIQYLNDYHLRLTPAEFDKLVDLYYNRYIKEINLTAVFDLYDSITAK